MTAQATPHPFSEQQWAHILQLLDGFDERQSLWLSGYLAARGQPAAITSISGSAETATKLLIAFGTETDNSRHLAETLAGKCKEAGIVADVVDLARVRSRQLTKREYLAIITATHGDGDPPEPTISFYEELMGDTAPSLDGLKFAVLALGDSSYEQFCVTGQEFDQRLEALGGKRLVPRQDCDVDFAAPAAQWMTQLLEQLPKTAAPANGKAVAAVASTAESPSKNQPLTVEVLLNQNLSSPQRTHPTHHLELALDTPDLQLEPGDAVGILVENPPDLVAAMLDGTGLSGEQPVTIDGTAIPLVQALRQHRDLTIPGSRFLETWQALSEAPYLAEIIAAGTKAQRAFLKEHQIIDLLDRFPAHPQPQQLVDSLRPLQPRLYDAANSLAAQSDELHLTVKAFHYPFGQRQEAGIASNYLLALQPGDQLQIYPHRNARFHLPEDPELPLVLIGDGTGIAPYRAFFQALAHSGQQTPCWLVFAEYSFEEDFLYQLDLQQARDDGLLQRVDTVFHQDQPDRSLATPLLEQATLLADWLNRGAHLYLCGDKERLETCERLLQAELDSLLGQGHWQQLAKAKRIHRNLY